MNVDSTCKLLDWAMRIDVKGQYTLLGTRVTDKLVES